MAGLVAVIGLVLSGLAGCGTGEEQASPLDGVTDPPGGESSAVPSDESVAGGDGAGGAPGEEPTEFPDVEVPEYTTDLDLTAEEIIEADEVLTVLEKELWFTNQTFQTGVFNEELAKEIMTASYAKQFRDDSRPVYEEGIRQKNDIEHDKYWLSSINDKISQDVKSTVEVCSDNTRTLILRPDGTDYFENPGTKSTIQYILHKVDGTWKINERYLVQEGCG